MSKPDFVWHRGYLAGEAGLRPEENPYAQRDGRVDERKAEAWEDGRQAGEEQFLRDVEDMRGGDPFVQLVLMGSVIALVLAAVGSFCAWYWFFG
ncbi:hypothetical protein JT317_gp44 [Klebsiella phage YMC16/01/N133_KPN_BP]|uniref:Uncharacterized protein n=1 Tax=Klebsiella phage YMC16/01/N133_KPN_BP TaxID=2026102 RepID=A0A248XD80_9CAUD|nr:hypothetical protein JT317_gp44 [Klebsiella phage YMC16/01/N133_KPN_BP]ASW27663.1 hypothetical protein KPNN133_044 [Klebsiella phage YMC16/01/N133_KPN_BP]